MAAFEPGAEPEHALDYRLAAGGFVALYWNQGVLREAVDWLQGQSYRVVSIEAGEWIGEEAMHAALASALDFPDYYGRNLDALNDCLSDVAAGDYGVSEDDRGLVLVLRRFDEFVRVESHAAHSLLDAFASQARIAALVGRRMLCLVQSNDGDLSLSPIGATRVTWNDAEWLDSKRR